MTGHRPADDGASRPLYRTVAGSTGSTVVLLHGLFGQGRNWNTIAKRLAGEYRVISVDLPNHGRSPWTDQVSYPDMAEAVAGLIEETAGTRPPGPVAVVGHSMGGKVAMTLALLHPDLVERLVVVDVSPVRYERQRGFASYVAGMRALDLTTLPDRATAERQLQPYVDDPMITGFLLQNLRRSGDGVPGWRWQINLDLLGDHLAELGDWPEPPAAPYQGPVLWLAGADSRYVTPERAPAMRTLFPRVRLVTVRNAGHWLHAEQPEVVLAALRRFLHPD